MLGVYSVKTQSCVCEANFPVAITNTHVHGYAVFPCFSLYILHSVGHKWVPVIKAWRVLRLRMKEQPPDMEDSCEYINPLKTKRICFI
jgi:hypothetical protein